MKHMEHRSTTRVLDILELLSKSQTGYTLTEICHLLEAPKSSLFPIIHTLENRNFIRQSADSTHYLIGQKSYLVGSGYKSEQPILELIKGNMHKLSDACRETCHLGILTGGNVLYIAKYEAKNPIVLRSHVGQSLPAYCTGIGKALIFNLSDEELRKMYPEGLKRHTEKTIVSFRELRKDLDQVKETGYAYEHAELTEDIECIAVPLCLGDKIIASVSVCIPTYRANDTVRDRIRSLLSEFRASTEPYLSEFDIHDPFQLL